MCISERLRLICEQKQWKIKDFAEITGLPYRTIQGYIGGEREPNAEGMMAISRAGINLNWLVTGKGEMFIKNDEDNEQHLNKDEQELLTQIHQCNEQGKKAISIMAFAISQNSNFQISNK